MSSAYTAVRWGEIPHFLPGHFEHPDRLDHSVVAAFDAMSVLLPGTPIVISDWRFPAVGSTSQHGLGRAIDFTVPGADSLAVLDAIKKSKRFSGYGMYTNDKGVESFHVDTRIDRTVSNPATWGAWKDAGRGVTTWQYVALSNIVDKIGKGAGLAVVIIALIGLYVLTSK